MSQSACNWAMRSIEARIEGLNQRTLTTRLGSVVQPRIVAEATGRATVRVVFFRASNRSRAFRMAGQFD
jgi:hypothetical protein